MTPLPNISTGDLKADHGAFFGWYEENHNLLTLEQETLAELIYASFAHLPTTGAVGYDKAKELHDADVAKLQAMLAG